MIPHPPRSTLLPYTTLFRSRRMIYVQDCTRRSSRSRPPPSPDNRFKGNVAERPATERSHADIRDRKSTRLNSSHSQISYAVFCLKKKKKKKKKKQKHIKENK